MSVKASLRTTRWKRLAARASCGFLSCKSCCASFVSGGSNTTSLRTSPPCPRRYTKLQHGTSIGTSTGTNHKFPSIFRGEFSQGDTVSAESRRNLNGLGLPRESLDKKIGFLDSRSQAKANPKNLARAPEGIEVRLASGPSFGGSFPSGLLKYGPPLARAQQTRRRVSLGISENDCWKTRCGILRANGKGSAGMRVTSPWSKVAFLIWSLADCNALSHAQRPVPPRDEETFRFRFVGPRAGNRVASIAGIPGDPSTYYAGAASGGIWKSTDGGNRWSPIFDKQPVAAIGALAVAPSAPGTVWAGTGEAWVIRDSDVMGNGIYKSTDAGKTWTNMGLQETGRIGRIVVHPTNPDIAFACALGRVTGPQQERGVFRTIDGGQHWERVLFPGENVGCSGLSMDPHNSHTLFAGMWQVEMHTWGEFSGGPGSGVYVSHDGGTKWTRIEEHGLPHTPVGKIDVAVAPTNSRRVFALIQTKDTGSVWRSDDAGTHWKAVNFQRALIGRAGYYIRLAVSTGTDNEVYVANSSFHQSLDGGQNFQEVRWGGDTHDIWVDPANPDRFVITEDAGMNITTVHGRGFHHVTLPIGQMYHVDVDNQVPYYFYSNMQDNGNMRGPSVPVDSGETGWDRHMGGCESGFTVPDTADPNVVWATCYGNTVTRWDARYKEAHSVSPWKHTLDSPPNDLKYRCHWTPPLAIDPFDHNTVYYGCQVIFRTTNAGQSWSVVSPDLSTRDPSRIVPSGGIVGDNLGQFAPEVVFAIATSDVEKGLIWAGTNDGKVWYTRDGGQKWNDVSKNIAGMPAWGIV